ncbi:unnamed protein product [Clonostachys rhizophaga]|uniref:Uncharacterized protein n=1 Tax=Clonostachys rhizophaga TaxID=160324 RepID=A0A9N9YQZ2_9HYPO|nr:unnamed protein product [Clonostachys rhizophaga]
MKPSTLLNISLALFSTVNAAPVPEEGATSVDQADRPIQWLKREDAPASVDDATVDRVNRIIVWKRGAETPTKVDDVSVDRVNRIIVW